MPKSPTPQSPAERRQLLKKQIGELPEFMLIMTSTTGCITHMASDDGELELVKQPPHKSARN